MQNQAFEDISNQAPFVEVYVFQLYFNQGLGPTLIAFLDRILQIEFMPSNKALEQTGGLLADASVLPGILD